jgi:hypothetical protein
LSSVNYLAISPAYCMPFNKRFHSFKITDNRTNTP